MRIEVAYRPHLNDGRAVRLLKRLAHRAPELEGLTVVDVYLLQGTGLPARLLADVFLDPVAQEMSVDSPLIGKLDSEGSAPGIGGTAWDFAVEVVYRPGVTDPVALTARDALKDAGGADGAPEVRSAVQYIFRLPESDEAVRRALARALYNPLIQQARIIERHQWHDGLRFADWYPSSVAESPDLVEQYDLSGLGPEPLMELSRRRLLALNAEEMDAIRAYFADPRVVEDRGGFGLDGSITDVELEMIAQTWSEHCKHKIFNAEIAYRELGEDGSGESHAEHISSLFSTYIRDTTESLWEKRPFLKSVFHDNSGVIAFDDDHLVCFKAETHNSPSALDPYGGAITGIVGVNRDILGTGMCAKPIFNTDVLCFGYPDTDPASLPQKLLHPTRIMEGVHRGIVDGGNQSGIPVVAGGFLFDETYTGKPLVFCGTGGLLPAWIGDEEGWVKHVNPGDFAVMVGGRIGKDGIHGATFSSQALDETSPTSAVQIGDPITQRKMTDFLLEARDLRLFRGITDNGAGGLSSSLGEMAESSGGVHVNLDACPLKYEGLAAWEIFVSESQERMSLAVSPELIEEFLELARRRDVEATVVGQFTDSGYIDIDYHGQRVCHVSLDFLHHGLPVMRLNAVWRGRSVPSGVAPTGLPSGAGLSDAQNASLPALLLAVLGDPNVASKEPLIRQFDHEVKGQSVIKPFMGEEDDGVTDGAVLRPLYDSNRGLTVTHGICPRYSDYDTYNMALCAVDEAYRSHIVLGGDPEYAAVLDNFCWPDPVQSDETPDGEHKLAQLVRACRGLRDACIAYGLPLVSGKDSMKNDARMGGRKVSVRPTLLISLFGVVPDVRKALSADFKKAGSVLYVAGRTYAELGGSMLQRVIRRTGGSAEDGAFAVVPGVDLERSRALYQALSGAIDRRLILSAHDLSDGGLGVAVAECAIGGRLGAEVDLSRVPADPLSLDAAALLFSESASRFVVEVDADAVAPFEAAFEGLPVARVGVVTARPTVKFTSGPEGELVALLPIDELVAAWKMEM